MELKINTLIEKAENLVYNEQLGFAAEIRTFVQEVKAPDGRVYELQLLITCHEKDFLNTE